MEDYKERIEIVKSIMKAKGIKRFNDLADKMDMLPNTLSTSLRYMTKNESYSSSFAKKLFKTLEIDQEQFEKYVNEGLRVDVTSSVSMMEEKGELFSKISNSYQKEISKLIENLNDGDTYTLVTTENPWEFRDIEIRTLILDRIKAGVKFRYVYPKVTELTEKAFEVFENNIEWFGLEMMHKKYLNKMLQLSQDDEVFKKIDEYRLDPRKYISDHLQYHLVEDTLLTHPMFKFMLLQMQVYGGEKRFAFAEAIVGESYTELNNEQNSFWYPLPSNASLVVFKSLERSIKKP